jgi:anti-sigma B factor antagonist
MPHHPYELTICNRAPGEVRLRVSGEIDLATAPSLLDSVLCAGLTYDAGHKVVIDLAEVRFIDSSGLAALVEADRWLGNQEQMLVIASPPEQVVRLFELTGLDQILRLDLGAERSIEDRTAID